MAKFVVKVSNEILGDSEMVMTLDELEKYNIVAYRLACLVGMDGKEHKSGMWAVGLATGKRLV